MSKSKIEWTEFSWNVTTGCTRVSSGCNSCYAVSMTRRLGKHPNEKIRDKYSGLVNEGKNHFNGKIKLHPEELEKPLHWRKPRMVFVNSMSDLFHPDVPFEFVAAVFGVMGYCRDHTFQILTKRPDRMAWFFDWIKRGEMKLRGTGENLHYDEAQKCIQFAISKVDHRDTVLMSLTNVKGCEWPFPNIWLGTSCEDQAAADERIPHLLKCPAAVRFLSCEPLLGPVDLSWIHCSFLSSDPAVNYFNALDGNVFDEDYADWQDDMYPFDNGIDWCIVGGESGPNARPMQIEWARQLKDQCKEANVSFFMKQICDNGRKIDYETFPEDLKIREVPAETSFAL